ncbi:hypothetical protein [Streptomyces sp. DSM 40868]|uniref:hypothetical protein n=1 Tax=Streptomyces sp. DSM 40868 TaxID=2721173 RepID=UPI001FCC8F39|nr:hypothetical protein [Streptomyces sp. DSM 40868]
MPAGGGGERGRAAEGDVEQGREDVDAQGVLKEGPDVSGAEPGGDLDDRAPSGGIDDDFRVRSAVADADRPDRRAHLPVYGCFGRRGQADGEAVPRLHPARAARRRLSCDGQVRGGAVLRDGLDAVLGARGVRLDDDARTPFAAFRSVYRAGGVGRWRGLIQDGDHGDPGGARAGGRLDDTGEADPAVAQGIVQFAIVMREPGVGDTYPGLGQHTGHGRLVTGRVGKVRIVSGQTELGADQRGQFGEVLIDGEDGTDTMTAGIGGDLFHGPVGPGEVGDDLPGELRRRLAPGGFGGRGVHLLAARGSRAGEGGGLRARRVQ